MLDEATVRLMLAHAIDSMDGWQEPGGALVPTEPDPDERARVRHRLAVHIHALMVVLEFPRDELDEAARLAGV